MNNISDDKTITDSCGSSCLKALAYPPSPHNNEDKTITAETREFWTGIDPSALGHVSIGKGSFKSDLTPIACNIYNTPMNITHPMEQEGLNSCNQYPLKIRSSRHDSNENVTVRALEFDVDGSLIPRNYPVTEDNGLFFPDLSSSPSLRCDKRKQSDQENFSSCTTFTKETSVPIVTPQRDLELMLKVPYRGAALSSKTADFIMIPSLRSNAKAEAVETNSHCHDQSLKYKSTKKNHLDCDRSISLPWQYFTRRRSSLGSLDFTSKSLNDIFVKKSAHPNQNFDTNASTDEDIDDLSAPSLHLANPIGRSCENYCTKSRDDTFSDDESIEDDRTLHSSSSGEDAVMNFQPSTVHFDFGDSLCMDTMATESDAPTNCALDASDRSESFSLISKTYSDCSASKFRSSHDREKRISHSRALRQLKREKDALAWLQSITVDRNKNEYIAEAMSSKFLNCNIPASRSIRRKREYSRSLSDSALSVIHPCGKTYSHVLGDDKDTCKSNRI